MSQRSGIAVYLIRRSEDDVEVLLLRRAAPRFFGEWFPVEGWIEAAESSEQAALRELREETAVDPKAFYRAEIEPVVSQVGVPIHVFVGFVSGDVPVSLNREHSIYEWFQVEDAIRRLPLIEQRRALEHIVANFVFQSPPEGMRIEIEGIRGNR